MHGAGSRHGTWRVVAVAAAGALAGGLGGCKDDGPDRDERRPAASQPVQQTAAPQPDEPAGDPGGDDEIIVRDGVALHAPTGLIASPGYREVASTCTACHSAQLVVQNRMTRDRWAEVVRWMQDEHNLWTLSEDTRTTILDYLAAQYGVPETRRLRRQPLPPDLMPPTRAELDRGSIMQKRRSP